MELYPVFEGEKIDEDEEDDGDEIKNSGSERPG